MVRSGVENLSEGKKIDIYGAASPCLRCYPPHNPHLTLELDPEVPNHETSKWKIKEVFLVLFGLQI